MSCLSCRISAASGSCRVSKQCIWPLGCHPSSLLHMKEHCLPSEFNDSRHLILDKPTCSFANQAGKGGKTDTLGKTLAKKKKKKCSPPFNPLLCNSPLTLICLIKWLLSLHVPLKTYMIRKVIRLAWLIFRGERNSINPKLFFCSRTFLLLTRAPVFEREISKGRRRR